MKTNITKKQFFMIQAVANYLYKIGSWNEEGECYPEIDYNLVLKYALELDAFVYDMYPSDDEEENTEG